MNFKIIPIILLWLAPIKHFSQTIIDFSEIKFNLGIDDDDQVGRKAEIVYKDKTPLQAGKYFCFIKKEISKSKKDLRFSFEIDDKGAPIGIIELEPYASSNFKFFIKNDIVERFELSDYETCRIIEVEYNKNDSVVTNFYTKTNKLILKKIIFKEERIYYNSCRYDENGKNTIGICHIEDKTKGTNVGYDGDRITYKQKNKNLPLGVKETRESYDENGKLESSDVFYVDGKWIEKKVSENGDYNVTTYSASGNTRQEFNKNGKLVKKYVPVSLSK